MLAALECGFCIEVASFSATSLSTRNPILLFSLSVISSRIYAISFYVLHAMPVLVNIVVNCGMLLSSRCFGQSSFVVSSSHLQYSSIQFISDDIRNLCDFSYVLRAMLVLGVILVSCGTLCSFCGFFLIACFLQSVSGVFKDPCNFPYVLCTTIVVNYGMLYCSCDFSFSRRT